MVRHLRDRALRVAGSPLVHLAIVIAWVVVNALFVCVSREYELVEQFPLEAESNEGVVFTGRSSARGLTAYSSHSGCIDLAMWRKGDSGAWMRDEKGPQKYVTLSWTRDGRQLMVVEGDECDGEERAPGMIWAISPSGKRIAWIASRQGRDGEDTQSLYVATPRGGRFPLVGEVQPVVARPLREVGSGVRGLLFADDDSVLVWLAANAGQAERGDEAVLWDCVNDRSVRVYKLTEKSSALAVDGEVVASASFETGVVNIASPTLDGWARAQIMSTIKEGSLESPSKRGTALGFGPNHLAVLASSGGTYSILRRAEGGPDPVLVDHEVPEVEGRIDHAVWLDENTIAFAGGFGFVAVVPIVTSGASGPISQGDPYRLPLKTGVENVRWLAVDRSDSLLAYGTSEEVIVGELRRRCEHPSWGRIAISTSVLAGLLAFVAKVASWMEKKLLETGIGSSTEE